MPQTLKDARVGLIAEIPGWRNPTALTLGAQAMGGMTVTVTAGLEGAEPLADLAGYLDNWVDLMAVRTPSLAKLCAFADALHAPVINLRTHDNHPCEVLGDLAYVLAQRGRWDGLDVVIIGPWANIVRSWLEAAAVLPIRVTQIAPAPLLAKAEDLPARGSATSELEAVERADLIVTDCWPSALSPAVQAALTRYRVDRAMLDRCSPSVLFIPCPPVTRGQEVSADAMADPRCHATRAKAYLLHIQNALMEWALR